MASAKIDTARRTAAGRSEWTLRGTRRTGETIEVRGCDLLEFVDGKISRKDSFWKIVE
jgi:ketosteroid isomerase-like protein